MRIKDWQAKRGYTEPGKIRVLQRTKGNRLKYGTPRAKWLEELKSDELSGISLRQEDKHDRGCHRAA